MKKGYTQQLNGNPLVSIVVITYNSAKYVLETLESAKAQTYQNIELIVSDDCSTDNTVEICRKWIEENKDRFIRTELITVEKNTGIPANCNRAMHAAKGEFVSLIAGDDYMSLDKIEKLLKYFDNRPEIAAVSGNVLTINEFGEIRNKQSFSSYRELVFIDFFVKGENINAAALIKKEVVFKVGLYNPNFMIEDYYMWLKITNLGYTILKVNDFMGYYRLHNTSMISNYHKMSQDLELIINEYKDEKEYPKALQYFYYRSFLNYASFNFYNKGLALKFLLKIKSGIFKKKFIKALVILIVPKVVFNKYIEINKYH